MNRIMVGRNPCSAPSDRSSPVLNDAILFRSVPLRTTRPKTPATRYQSGRLPTGASVSDPADRTSPATSLNISLSPDVYPDSVDDVDEAMSGPRSRRASDEQEARHPATKEKMHSKSGARESPPCPDTEPQPRLPHVRDISQAISEHRSYHQDAPISIPGTPTEEGHDFILQRPAEESAQAWRESTRCLTRAVLHPLQRQSRVESIGADYLDLPRSSVPATSITPALISLPSPVPVCRRPRSPLSS